MNTYQREGKNKHDDAPDATTGIAETMAKGAGWLFQEVEHMGVKAEIKIENIEELKKLIDKTNDQVDQLKKTLEEIEIFRIQVS